MTDNSNVTTEAAQSANGSTLIEFPGVNRNRPAWRKELSERFREIQQRRAREADVEDEAAPQPQPQPQQRRPAAGQTSAAPDDQRAAAPTQSAESAAKQLGLVPTPDEPALNPIVAAALRRVERARASATPPARQGSGRAQAATAAARVVEEQPEQAVEAEPLPQPAQAKRTSRRADKAEAESDAARPAPPLVVVQPKQPAQAEQPKQTLKAEQPRQTSAEQARQTSKAEPVALKAETFEAAEPSAQTSADGAAVLKVTAPAVGTLAAAKVSDAAPEAATDADTLEAQAASRQPRHISGVLDEFWLERQGIELLPKVAAPELTYDDRAPRSKRIAAAVVDLIAVAILSAPFAAAIELTIGNWGDPRVWGSMASIVALVMFLYHTCSIALAGRTLGMSLCVLQTVDARNASVPTTGQCMRRALVYMLSLATCGLGLLYSLFDAEGRTAHDILSGTVVVRK